MTFKPTPLARPNTGVAARITVTAAMLADAFGEPHEQAWEPEKGYGPSYYFTDRDGVAFSVYPRWNCYRVAGVYGPKLDAFLTWLAAELGADLKRRHFCVDADIRAHVAVDALFSKEPA